MIENEDVNKYLLHIHTCVNVAFEDYPSEYCDQQMHSWFVHNIYPNLCQKARELEHLQLSQLVSALSKTQAIQRELKALRAQNMMAQVKQQRYTTISGALSPKFCTFHGRFGHSDAECNALNALLASLAGLQLGGNHHV